jgi:hypothetical protein
MVMETTPSSCVRYHREHMTRIDANRGRHFLYLASLLMKTLKAARHEGRECGSGEKVNFKMSVRGAKREIWKSRANIPADESKCRPTIAIRSSAPRLRRMLGWVEDYNPHGPA